MMKLGDKVIVLTGDEHGAELATLAGKEDDRAKVLIEVLEELVLKGRKPGVQTITVPAAQVYSLEDAHALAVKLISVLRWRIYHK
jgi:hypothetical protein